ncbi:ABC transporter permease [Candidatus Bipolaricaulota bacterium]
MAEQPAGTPEATPKTFGKSGLARTLAKFARYTAMRGIALLATVAIGVYISVWIANMGGYVDKLRKAQVQEAVGIQFRGPVYRDMTPSERRILMDDQVNREIARLGLDKPFIGRSFGYLANALTLSLGRTERMTSDTGSKQVRAVLLERLPTTLVLFGTANLITFFGSLFISMFLSRRYGSFLDRASVALAPMSAAPPWFYGIFLILIFASLAGILPYGGMLDAPPPETTLGYMLSVLKHMLLPLLAWTLATIPIAVYARRTFFLIHSSEDYVELAKAKGLRSNTIERRYILRPTLPTIITQFALTLVFAWQGAIITETVFQWPGLGRLLWQAIGLFEVPVIIGSVVIFAYLLAMSVFLLDILYALIDPRVKLGAEGRS